MADEEAELSDRVLRDHVTQFEIQDGVDHVSRFEF